MATPDSRPVSDVAFTPAVKDIQTRRGSRHAYAHQEKGGGWQTDITPDLKAWIETQITAYLATANAQGQPYVQHRGGPQGFLRVLDEHTIAWADFKGNRQYITLGNLSENPKAHLFLMDYMHQQRVKIWGKARVVEGDDDLIKKLMPEQYKARGEQVIMFSVHAWDANCPQHIPQLVPVDEAHLLLEERDRRIKTLEATVERLRASARSPGDAKGETPKQP